MPALHHYEQKIPSDNEHGLYGKGGSWEFSPVKLTHCSHFHEHQYHVAFTFFFMLSYHELLH